MAYVPVPKDLNAVKTKVLFNLTKRQLICFGAGILIGLPVFFLTRKPLGNSVSVILMVLTLLPFMLLAMYEQNGQHLETVLKHIIDVCFLRPKVRPYKTNNLYDALERQERLDKEVYAIVRKEKTHASRETGHRGGNRTGKEKGRKTKR